MLQIKETGALVAEQNFAERIKVVGSKKRLVKKRENLEVVVSDSGRVSRVKRIENFVLSPNRVASTEEDVVKGSTVFFIKSTPQIGRWGGHIKCPPTPDDEDGYVLNLRLDFTFMVQRGDRLIALFGEDRPVYDNRYIMEKVRGKMGGTIKAELLKYVKANGYSALLGNMYDVAQDWQGKLNENVFYEYGLRIENLTFVAEKAEY